MAAMEVLTLAVAGFVGLIFGSFATVVADRVPQGLSVVRPRSACGACHRVIAPRDNIPVFSWLRLGGRCRHCQALIPWRYPVMEGGTAALCVLVALAIGLQWYLPAFLVLVIAGVPLAAIDVQHHRLPNAIVLPLYPIGLALLAFATWMTGDTVAMWRALVGGFVSFVMYLGLALIKAGAMGMGDVKLAGVLGLHLAYVDWGAWLVGLFAAFVCGSVVALMLLATKRATRTSAVPFGPFMLFGALVGIVAGPHLWQSYLALLT